MATSFGIRGSSSGRWYKIHKRKCIQPQLWLEYKSHFFKKKLCKIEMSILHNYDFIHFLLRILYHRPEAASRKPDTQPSAPHHTDNLKTKAPNTTGSNHLYNTLELLMMGIMVSETCWASNKICNKNHLFHLVGILFPHVDDDARSKPHQIKYIIYIHQIYKVRKENFIFTNISEHQVIKNRLDRFVFEICVLKQAKN